MTPIEELAERYVFGLRGAVRTRSRQAFIDGAKALSVAMREELVSVVDHAKPMPTRASRINKPKSMAEGHAWFTP
jgi:hypothetical protein